MLAHLHKKHLDHVYNKHPWFKWFPFKYGKSNSAVSMLSRIEPFIHTDMLNFTGIQVWKEIISQVQYLVLAGNVSSNIVSINDKHDLY